MTEPRAPYDRLPRTSEGTNTGAFAPLDWGLLATCTVIWGASFFFIEVALRDLTPGVITFLRVGLGALALAWAPASRRAVAPDDWPRLALLGAIWVAVPFTLFPLAQQWIESALTGMLNAAMPIMTAVVTLLLARRLPGPWQLGGLLFGLSGIVAIGWESLGEGSTTALGAGLVVLAVTCYAVSVNLAVPLQQRYGTLPVMLRVLGVATALTAPAAVFGMSDSTLTLRAAASVSILGVLGTGLAFLAMGTLAGRVGATRSSITTYLMPLVSITLGVTVLGERVPPSALGGIVLVLAGAWMVTRADRQVGISTA